MAPQTTRLKNRVVHSGKLNSYAAYWILARLNEASEKGYEDFILDLRECETAFPEGLVPLAALVDLWRTKGAGFELILPSNETAARLLLNCNFAHFVNPDQYTYNQTLLPKHVSIRRYDALKEQDAIDKEFVNIALNTMNLSRDVLQGIEWSLNEIMDNVLIHAQAPRGGFAQVMTLEDRVAFTVADCGRGVLASLREGYPGLHSDTDAIGEAVKGGVTRNPQVGQGNGLTGALRVATLSGGSFMVGSGRGIMTVFRSDKTTESHGRILPRFQNYQGTIVSAQILRDAAFKISDALDFPSVAGGFHGVVEAQYATGDGSAFTVKMNAEAPGFGSREAGSQLRTKLENLLAADRSKAVLVDWEGVPVISSSFADEAFGKLFVDLGPIEFATRVRNLKMDSLIRALIDKAIMQRTAQTVNQAAKEATTAPLLPKIEEAPWQPES